MATPRAPASRTTLPPAAAVPEPASAYVAPAASSPWEGVPLPFLIGAIGVGILALGSLIMMFMALGDIEGNDSGRVVAYLLFTTIGSVTLQVAFGLGAALRSRLGDGVRAALLIAAAFMGTSGVLGLLGLSSGFFR